MMHAPPQTWVDKSRSLGACPAHFCCFKKVAGSARSSQTKAFGILAEALKRDIVFKEDMGSFRLCRDFHNIPVDNHRRKKVRKKERKKECLAWC